MSATTLATMGVAACGSDETTSTSVPADAAGDSHADGTTSTSGGDANDVDGADAFSAFEAGSFDAAGDERPPPSPRRPFLVGTSLRSASSQARDDWSAARLSGDDVAGVGGVEYWGRVSLDPAVARELAKSWLADGLEEHASIAAFARFSMMMLSVSAPPELVAASQRASLDEIAHARDCFALSRRYGAIDAGPGPLDIHDSLGPGRRSLADLAALTAEEGCVGETLGAALAAEQLAVAVDPEVRRVLARIVRDEARHAELAWRFVAWAVAEEQRGAPEAAGVSAAVASAAAHAIAGTRAMKLRPATGDVEAWHAHGRLTCAEAREACERAIVDVILPCLEVLSAARREASAGVVSSSGCEGRVSPA